MASWVASVHSEVDSFCPFSWIYMKQKHKIYFFLQLFLSQYNKSYIMAHMSIKLHTCTAFIFISKYLILCWMYSYLYFFLQISVWIIIFIFTLANFSHYLIYLYLYWSKNGIQKNIFAKKKLKCYCVFSFAKKNQH